MFHWLLYHYHNKMRKNQVRNNFDPDICREDYARHRHQLGEVVVVRFGVVGLACPAMISILAAD